MSIISTARPGGVTEARGLLFHGGDAEELHRLVSTRFALHRMSLRENHPVRGGFRCIHEGAIALYELGYGTGTEVETGADIAPGVAPAFHKVHVLLVGAPEGTAPGTGTADGTMALPSPSPSPTPTPTPTHGIIGPGPGPGFGFEPGPGSEPRPRSWPAPGPGPGPGPVMRRNAGATANLVLIIPRPVLDRALAVRLGELPRAPLFFAPVFDHRLGVVGAWLDLVRAFAEFAASGLAARSPLATGHFEQLLVNGLLDAQPHELSRTVAGLGPAALPGAVRRAADFCAEHADEPISVADMARAARVSARSLRDGFRTHLGTTPLAYLRRIRLDLARDDLLAIAAGRATGTVTDVALRRGFTHLSRFTGHYRKAYGETPSQTVRGGRAVPRRRTHTTHRTQ
ncbi:AraC family transcriptional regulator [Streptomyces sp. NPDC089799]|uniref:helix-turn-helix transcriptional regulator n=1 Tax=Streptomyces sp. NPDC089799 TaxID=3155066 RepID=UPI0034251868